MTTDLTAFLDARLDEDERYLNSNRHHLWTQRPLREVAAKRAMVAAYEPNGQGVAYVLEAGLEFALGHLAAVYSDHRDYRQEWKP